MRKPSDTAIATAEAVFSEHGGVMCTREALEAGIHASTLYWMGDHGLLEALSRGVFHLSSTPLPESLEIAAVMRRAPKAVLCLVSALSYHEIGTQIPHAVQIALPRKVRSPRFDYPPIEVFNMSDSALSVGVEEHDMGGTAVRVFSVAKTVADCFKYRSKIGLDVAVEALQETVRKHMASPAQIMDAARVVRVESMTEPYLRALL